MKRFARSALAAALLAALSSPTFAQSADAPPSVPGNLSVRLYDGAGAELFWTRSTDDRGVRGYEITRDGRSLGIRDATSYYDRSIGTGISYTFTVTAIDTAGQRSPTATVSFPVSQPVTPTRPVTPTQPTAPVAGAPAAPTGLRAAAYSAGNGEIFWTRASTPGLSYEVSRNGTRVATSNGTSYYDASLRAGTGYTYSVVAIDSSGRRSAPSTVGLRTGGGPAPVTPATPATPTQPTAPVRPTVPQQPEAFSASLFASIGDGSPLSVGNYEQFLPTFYRIANVQPLESLYPDFLRVLDEIRAAQRGEESRFVARSTFQPARSASDGTSFDCPDGGTVAAEIGQPGRSTENAVFVNFGNCNVNGMAYRGVAGFNVSSPGNGAAFFGSTAGQVGGSSGTNLDIVGRDGVVANIDGSRFFSTGPDSVTWVASWKLDGFGGTLSVRNSTTFEDTGAGATFRTDGSFSGDLTNGRTITVTNLGRFVSTGSPAFFTSGQLGLRDSAGGILSLRSGESGTSDLTVRIDTAGRVLRALAPQTDRAGFRLFSVD